MEFNNGQDNKFDVDTLLEIEYTDDKEAFINKLLQLWEKYPHYRFGQLLKHIISEVHGNLFFIPDGVFQKGLEKFLEIGFSGVDRKEVVTTPNINHTLSVKYKGPDKE